jgi:hypothetical protein
MTYWNEKVDSHIRLGETDVYQTYPMLAGKINEQGYIDDIIGPSEVVYFGSCDFMSSLPSKEERWVSMLHETKYPDLPCMAIGTSGTGLPTTVRRLHSYIHNYGPPKRIYMSISRFESYEYVNQSGHCYNVNSRIGTPRYLKKRNLLSDREFNIWKSQVDIYKELYDIKNNQYILEERFAFIETMCKAYGIELNWTFNLSDAAIVILHRNIAIFEHISDFMKRSFVGLAPICDHLVDRSIGINTHKEIYKKFMNKDSWNYNKICDQAKLNFEWLEKQYGTDLIKNEN